MLGSHIENHGFSSEKTSDRKKHAQPISYQDTLHTYSLPLVRHDWLSSNYVNKNEKNRFMNDNYIPKNLDLSFSEKNFEEFWKSRKKLMEKELKNRLN